jgi:hypothetical protein
VSHFLAFQSLADDRILMHCDCDESPLLDACAVGPVMGLLDSSKIEENTPNLESL